MERIIIRTCAVIFFLIMGVPMLLVTMGGIYQYVILWTERPFWCVLVFFIWNPIQAFLYLGTGIGLFRIKEWGRKLGIFTSGYSVISEIPKNINYLSTTDPIDIDIIPWIVSSAARTLFFIISLIILTRRSFKREFLET